MTERRGIALVLVLAATVLVGSLTLLALHGAAIRVRLLADARWRTEGSLVASSALAAIRVAQDSALRGVADGALLNFSTVRRTDGWEWRAGATRSGALIWLEVLANRRAADGTLFAARRTSLLLVRDPADTVRVLARRARF